MDFERAHQAAELGERLVSQELDRIAPDYGARVIANLLLMVEPGITARLAHVVVDRFGALIVDARVGNGAQITGSDGEREWRAQHADGRAFTFPNPLARNREHETVVRQALRETGNWFGPDYVKSAVVFGGADLSGLALDPRTRSRIVDVAEVETLLRERQHSAPAGCHLSDGQIAGLAGLFRGLDHSGDARVLQRHAEHVLKELAPEKHALLMNAEKPAVAEVPAGTKFTWEYLCSSALVNTLSLTLDASGRLVEVEIP